MILTLRGIRDRFYQYLFCGLLAVAAAATPADANSIESINVVGNGNAIMIETTEPVRYTVFKLIDPPRLIVDIPGVEVSKIKSPLKVDNDFVTKVTVSGYTVADKAIGRVEIGLKESVEHKVKSGENSILVSLERGFAAASEEKGLVTAATEEKAAEPVKKAEAPAPKPAEKKVAATEPAPKPSAAAAASAKATSLVSIQPSAAGEKTVVKIATDGPIESYYTFGLDEQASVVVDVVGVESAIEEYLIPINSAHVSSVRIGEHPDKVRLVFKSKTAKTPSFSAVKGERSIELTIGAPGDEAVEMAAFGSAEPSVSSATSRVLDVDFEKTADRARITIKNSTRTRYTVQKTEDGLAIAIDLQSSTIPEGLERTIDATALGSPVTTVSSYQLSTDPESKVRILVKLTEDAPHKVLEDGTAIKIDFPAEATVAAAGVDEFEEAYSKAQQKVYTGEKLDLDMVDTDIRDILKLLAEVSDLNIIAADDVKGAVTMRLKDVPWDQAFDLILISKNLDKLQIGNVVRVAPADRIRKEKEAALAAQKAREKLEPLQVRYVQINYEEAANLLPHVNEVLSDRGSVTSHEGTNTLIVKDIGENIKSAVDVVANLDRMVPQVLIEARIVEAESSFARDLGIQWGVDYSAALGDNHWNVFGSQTTEDEGAFGQAAYDPGLQSAPAAGGGVYPQEKTGWPARPGVTNYAINLPAAGSVGPLGALGFIFGTAGANPMILDLRLSAGEQNGQLKTISRPRITTLNNKEAKIEQGESIPFQTTSAAGTETKFIDANLSLTVTPQITPDGSVLMEIKASRNSIGSFRTSGGEPSINKKEAQTEVLVKDGETTVIGGIVVSDTREGINGIPFLKDIPVLGWAFKNDTTSDSQQELLIFITPTIIRDDISIG